MVALFAAAEGRAAAVYKANPTPPTDGRVGTNYTPAYAVNQVQFWHDFRPDVVERELAAARKYFGISTLRVFLHTINFFEERPAFLANLEAFLAICDRHGIRPGFVFFDGCHRHEGIFLDKPTEPVKGWHNGRWAQSPQAREIDKDNLEKFKPYVQEVIRPHRTDGRLLFWEIHNEPPPGDKYRNRLKRAAYRWAKEVGPIQPVLNCEKGERGWADCDVTDIVDAHQYLHNYGPLNYLSDVNPNKGTVFTEAGARWKARIRNFGDPCEMIHWLQERKAAGKSTPGVFLCWELMVGHTNTRWHWRDKPSEPEPEIPWCGLMWPNCTPVSLAEAEAVRAYAAGEPQAMLYSNFEHATKGWKPYGVKELKAVNALQLEPGVTAVAGDEAWADYVLEGTVALRPSKDGQEGGAGFLLRLKKAGDDLNAMRGYAVTFNTKKQLVLSRIENGWSVPLETFDLTRLDTRSRMNEWSMMRVAVVGPRIRVWFNRMHPSADPDRGLRIDFTDKDNPVPAGAIGVRTCGVPAWFDNVIVLPSEALPQPSTAGAPRERTPAGPDAHAAWTQSYDAGYTDAGGACAGGSEIMHLVPHKGKLYAANGYWMDSRWSDAPYAERQSAQVLRLDAADGRWQVDLDMGRANPRGLRYMKGNILKSVTFTRTGAGAVLPEPRTLLVAAAGAYRDGQGFVSAWVRDDTSGTWRHGIVKSGSRAGGTRWVPRDMEVHTDKATGAERLFLLLGNPGILSGVYDPSQPTGIRWNEEVEFPARGTLPTRPLGIVEANGSLLFSAGGVIYRRVDGPNPTYAEVLNLGGDVNTDVGGIRGLTAIPNPDGPGESILFVWVPDGRSPSRIKRLDPDARGGYTLHDEADISTLMSEYLSATVGYSLAAHSNMVPVVHPGTGDTVHLIGFLGRLPADHPLQWNGSRLYAGALYAVRAPDATYTVHEVGGAWAPGKPVLVSPRTFARSPFGDDLIFVGGHDASGRPSDDMAWIFKAPLDVVLGGSGTR